MDELIESRETSRNDFMELRGLNEIDRDRERLDDFGLQLFRKATKIVKDHSKKPGYVWVNTVGWMKEADECKK